MHEVSRGAAARPVAVRCVRRGGSHRQIWPGGSAGTAGLRRYAGVLAPKLSRGQFAPEDPAQELRGRWLRRRRAGVAPRAWAPVVLRRLRADRLRRRGGAAEVPAEGMALAVVEPEPMPW